MPNSYMQLGPIAFQEYEVPSSIRFGGQHRIAVHTLFGGARTLERLGPADSEIQFEGIFSGPDAESRAMAFDELRLSGTVVWLAWQAFRRLVIVKTFSADYHTPWWISYQVSCVVVTQNLSNIDLPPILAAGLGTDLSNALAAASLSGIGLTSLQGALSPANAAVPGTSDQRGALGTVQTTLTALGSEVDRQSLLVEAPPPEGVNGASLSAYVADLTAAAGGLASAVATRSYVGRIGVHLNG